MAALLLLTSLLLPWDVGTQASERVDVVLVTLLSVAALALPHLARAKGLSGADIRKVMGVSRGRVSQLTKT